MHLRVHFQFEAAEQQDFNLRYFAQASQSIVLHIMRSGHHFRAHFVLFVETVVYYWQVLYK